MDGSNRLTRGVNTSYDELSYKQNIRYGEVMSIEDPLGLGRIKVWIKGSVINGGDDEKLTEENGVDKLPWTLPMLPKHINIVPKIGEGVLIFSFSKDKENADRLYLGPIISQSNKLDFDSARTTALAGFTFGPITPDVNPRNIPDLRGVFPEPEDISLQGRFNTEITQKNNEILIRAGKFVSSNISSTNPYPIRFNTESQGYIQIKNDVKLPKLTETEVSDRLGTVTNIVSNKINLITHGGSPTFNLTNQDNLISDSELEEIFTSAHPLPFGDILLEYLILLKEAFLSHVHNGSVPTDLTVSGNKQSVAEFIKNAARLEQNMLSKNIRIN
jgi:hypothetical protein